MYTLEQRKRAVELYIQYGHNGEAVCRQLGYPSASSLVKRWYEEGFFELDPLRSKDRPNSYFVSEQGKQRAVQYYLDCGRNLAKTAKDLGVTRRALESWIDALAPGQRRCRLGSLQFHKVNGLGSPKEEKEGVSEEALMEEDPDLRAVQKGLHEAGREKARVEQLLADAKAELAETQERLRQAKMELDLAARSHELLKKSPGADLIHLTNREKAVLVGALKGRYGLNELLACVALPRSSYFYQRKAVGRPDRYAGARPRIRELFDGMGKRFGYRTIWARLRREGVRISEKAVRRIMSEEGMRVVIRRRRGYSSYRGEGAPSAANLLERDFSADAPNTKWLTDITEFRIPAGKVYLSPVLDCFDGKVVSWTAGTSPNANLVNDMLDAAIAALGRGERPVVHSDRGCHYRWPGWIERMSEAGLTRSMSRKGCSPDNAACEGFFGRLKNEFFYYRSWKGVSIEEFTAQLGEYLRWYNEGRIKKSLGWMSPSEYRLSKGLAI